MADDVEQLVSSKLKVIDEASGPLGKVAEQAAKTEGIFSRIEGALSRLMPLAGAAGIALSFKGVFDTTEQYLKRLKEVHELTGASASQADFLFSNARKAGVEFDTMQRVMFQLSRRGAMLESTMAAAANRVPGMAKKFEHLGVDMTKGPVAALTAMSKAVKAGKVDAGELMAQFRVPPSQVNDFKEFLAKLDPEQLAKLKAGGKGFVGDEDLRQFLRMEQAQHRIGDAWNRIQVMLGKTLLPIAAEFAERFAARLEKLVPVAEEIGVFLVKHMGKIVKLAKTFAAIMTAKKLLSALTSMTSPGGMIAKLAIGGASSGAGGAGLAGQLGGVVSVLGAALPALLGIAAAVGLIYAGYKAVEDNLNGIGRSFDVLYENIVADFEQIGGELEHVWERVEAIFGGKGTFVQFVEKIAGGTLIGALRVLDNMLVGIDVLIKMIGQLAPEMMGGIVGALLAFPKAFETYVLDPIIRVVSALGNFIRLVLSPASARQVNAAWDDLKKAFFAPPPGDPVKMLGGSLSGIVDRVAKSYTDNLAQSQSEIEAIVMKNRAEDRAKREHDATSKLPPTNNYDFRGSRFDITQNFAEGFDPDRVAVAFANDLSALGEQKTQSGFQPIFAVR